MKKLPKILIIGRQNVGKSTLFNQLIKKKHAIVHDTPGLTRDYMVETVLINDCYYQLIDTGGLTDNKKTIESIIKKQVLNLFKDIHLILFIVEKKGLMSLDFNIADLVRKVNKKIILIVNKADDITKIDNPELLSEFYELGFDHIIPISAEHKINFALLYNNINNLIPDKVTSLEDTDAVFKIAILGKPNVGKSSIINKLSNSQRVIVTETPGTTRDSIDVEIKYHNQTYTFIDTAGIRKKSRINSNIEYYSINRAIKSIKRSDMVVMVLSAEDLLSDPDKKIFKYINEQRKPCLIVANKWDLIDKEDNIHNIMTRKIMQKFPLISYIPVLFISAKTGHNIQKIFSLLFTINNNYNHRIQTAKFNDFVQKIINKYSPPQAGGHIKISYGTQIGTAPPRFIFFTNKPDQIKQNYQNFLINKIREKFDYSGCPIILKFRKK